MHQSKSIHLFFPEMFSLIYTPWVWKPCFLLNASFLIIHCLLREKQKQNILLLFLSPNTSSGHMPGVRSQELNRGSRDFTTEPSSATSPSVPWLKGGTGSGSQTQPHTLPHRMWVPITRPHIHLFPYISVTEFAKYISNLKKILWFYAITAISKGKTVAVCFFLKYCVYNRYLTLKSPLTSRKTEGGI